MSFASRQQMAALSVNCGRCPVPAPHRELLSGRNSSLQKDETEFSRFSGVRDPCPGHAARKQVSDAPWAHTPSHTNPVDWRIQGVGENNLGKCLLSYVEMSILTGGAKVLAFFNYKNRKNRSVLFVMKNSGAPWKRNNCFKIWGVSILSFFLFLFFN